MVGKPNGTIRCLSVKGGSESPLLNFTGVHFSKVPNIGCWLSGRIIP